MQCDHRMQGEGFKLKIGMNMKIKAFFAMAAACCLAFSCSGPVELGGSWVIDSVNGEKVVTGEKIPFINFNEADGRIHGCFGVNIVNGTYTLDGDKLTFSQLASTMMAGLPADMEVESKVNAAIGTVASVEVKGENMSLKNAEGDVVLTLVKAAENPRAAGTDGASASEPADSVVALGAAADSTATE